MLTINIETDDPQALEMYMRALGFVRASATPAIATAKVETDVKSPAPEPQPQPSERAQAELKPWSTATEGRERGKAAPGKRKRTAAEVAEDEAGDAYDAANPPPQQQAISSGEERINPDDAVDDTPEEQAQDAKDEADEASLFADSAVTIEDLKNAVTDYSNAYGVPAAKEDMAKIFEKALGKPPEGEAAWKFSIVPTDPETLKKAVTFFIAARTENPFKRTAVTK